MTKDGLESEIKPHRDAVFTTLPGTASSSSALPSPAGYGPRVYTGTLTG